MNELDWLMVEELFHQAHEVPAEEREAFLEPYPENLRTVVAELLGHRNADEVILRTIEGAAALYSQPAGQVGPWRLVRPIGEGGMGTVFEAVRADDAFERTVAIKFVRQGMDSPVLRARFEAERRILARLEHPHIARLLDAGTTREGLPYLVMEFVEGRNVIVHAEEEKLSVREMIRLFLKICSAVDYAHRNLVVHRDLKPGNILIDPTGAPKLLDFGIAKLLDTERVDAEGLTQMRMMSPDWASPEQIRGETVTTATDVYSLGAVLYKLLCGQAPFRTAGLSAAEAERVITQTEAPRLSERNEVVGRQLRGNLEVIVQKAMRREPKDRYLSVAELAADLQRHLAGRPILAREYSAAARSAMWVKRHKASAAAVAVAVMGLTGGALVATRSAIQAGVERSTALRERGKAEAERRNAFTQEALAVQKAQEAEKQKTIAERSLADEHKVLSRFVEDFYADMMNLPGSTAARQAILETGIQALEKLVSDSPGDDLAQNTLARAYERMGELLASQTAASLNDPERGMRYYDKAAAIMSGLLKKQPGNPDYLLGAAVINRHIGMLLTETGAAESVFLPRFAAAIRDGRRALAGSPNDPDVREDVLELYLSRCMAVVKRGGALPVADLEAARKLSNQNLRDRPGELATVAHRAQIESVQAQFLTSKGEHVRAQPYYEQNLKFREEAVRLKPNDMAQQRVLMIALSYMGNSLRQTSGPRDPRILQVNTRVAEIAGRISAADPLDRTAKFDLAMSLNRVGLQFTDSGQFGEALAPYEKSVRLMRELRREDAMTPARQRSFVVGLVVLGDVQTKLSRDGEAAAVWQEAIREADALVAREPKDKLASAMAARAALALARSATGDRAAEQRAEAVARAEKVDAAEHSPAARNVLAQARGLVALAGTGEAAREMARRAEEAVQGIPESILAGWPAAERARIHELAAAEH